MSPKAKSSDQTINRYLDEISKHPLLTAEEERELSRRVASGDAEALATLVTSNLRLVVAIVKAYSSPMRSLDDLISDGNVGLIRAAKRFDGSRGFRFSTYACHWIRQAVQHKHSHYSHQVYLPRNMFLMLSAMARRYKRLMAETADPEKAMKVIARERNMTLKHVRVLLGSLPSEASIDDRINPYSATMDFHDERIDFAEMTVNVISAKSVVSELLSVLSPQQRTVISLYYGLADGKPMNQADVAREMHLSRERIRVVYNLAMARMMRYHQRLQRDGMPKKKR